MSRKDDPHRKADVTSPWESLARELAANPDSPASLRILSAVNNLFRPNQQAVDQLVTALVEQLDSPGSAADAAVDAARANWEHVCGIPLDESTLELMRQDAAAIVASRARKPPDLRSIVAGVQERTDVGYDMGLHLHGLEGTWHRLWAMISTARAWGDGPDEAQGVATVRAQFEQALGRALTAQEWAQLEAHAHHHADTVLIPKMNDMGR